MKEISTAHIKSGDIRSLAKAISLVENQIPGANEFLCSLETSHIPIIGITGAPGAGKSTLTDAILRLWIAEGKKVAVLCIDPSSPFHRGALLGDRIRMQQWQANPKVYIRSLSSRGTLGGLNPSIIEITTVLSAAPFDRILIETVGVGQNEIDIARLADITVVVTVPEGGDDIQAMKSGLMEIADIFVVNKSDRPDADRFTRNLEQNLRTADERIMPTVIKTIASEGKGITELVESIDQHLQKFQRNEELATLLSLRAYELIAKERMKDIHPEQLQQYIGESLKKGGFNLFLFIHHFLKSASTAS